MKYLPFDSFTIPSNRSYDEVHRILEREVMPKGSSVMSGVQQEPAFKGEVGEDHFKIMRNIRYQNSFLPIISGRIVDNYPGTNIHVRMRAAISVYIFMAIWFTAVGFGLYFTLREMVMMSFIPMIMLVFGYLLMFLGYKFEARKARRILEGLFGDATTVQEPMTDLEKAIDKLVKKSEEAQ